MEERLTEYEEFIKKKQELVQSTGFMIDRNELSSNLFEFQKDLVSWALSLGKAAIFAMTGMGKTRQEIEFAYQVHKKFGCNALIVAPLAVSEQTIREGKECRGIEINNFRKHGFKEGINIVNYEYLDHIDASLFGCVVLDESSRLKSFTAETTKKSIEKFSHCEYKLLGTATPAPNDYMELGTSAEFLDVMKRREMLSTFFIHDSGETSQWRLKKHAENVFWEWVASWGAVLTKPSDLGYDDDAYNLPELKVNEIIVKTGHTFGGGFFSRQAETLQERREARKIALPFKIERVAEEINNSDDITFIWCDLNLESEMLKKAIDDSVEIAGRHTNEYKEENMLAFADGKIKRCISKPKLAGHGMNFQVCHKTYFIGLSDSFEQFFQAVRRFYRFGQKEQVEVNIISSDIEGATLENIKRKEKNANRMLDALVKKTNKYVRENIGNTKRLSKRYFPTVDMIVPEWLKEEK